ncbi:hypothetical protein QM480_06595 [Flectobacillus sp. DC10W]|uniref:Uncharacterized protein n=1 Tax=Flectobacillus longus TaxID=2984207 RepID=A0ABT6YK73_9BACT|nr:hypothetical protein [Flectobacillus longus]MDI9863984.1 hypothetical protein [Flectobacillus longus]
MTQKFKVGDLVYCAKRKMFGYIVNISELDPFVSIYFSFDECQNLSHYWLTGKRNTIFKVVKLNTELAFDFANYCISEGFASRAIKRDLVTFLNSKK